MKSLGLHNKGSRDYGGGSCGIAATIALARLGSRLIMGAGRFRLGGF